MHITQTVKVPASRRLTIDVPREIPSDMIIITFAPVLSVKEKMPEAQEIELINRNAERLNEEALDVLSFQNLDAFDEDLERLTPQDFAVMHGATVPFSLADVVSKDSSDQ